EILEAKVAEIYAEGFVTHNKDALVLQAAESFVEGELPRFKVGDKALVLPHNIVALVEGGGETEPGGAFKIDHRHLEGGIATDPQLADRLFDEFKQSVVYLHKIF